MLPYSSSETPGQPSIPYRPPVKPPRNKMALIIGIVLGVIALAGIAFAVYYIFFRPPLPDISIQVSKPEQALLGEPFKLTVAYTNASDQVLKNAVVAVTVPEGVAIIGVDPSTRLGQQTVGDVEAQGIGTKTFDLIATDGENSVKHVSVAFRYRMDDSNAPPYERTAATDISVGGPAVSLNFDVPQSVFAGQVFDVSLAYQNNSKTAFQNAKLIFDYPQMFQFQAASSSPSVGNNEWDLGALAPGGQGSVTVTGNVTGGQQSFFAMGVHLQVELNGHRYDLGAQTTNIGIQNTPLALSIAVNRKANYVSSLGDKLSYTLSYRNGSGFALQNLVIQAALQGEMLDLGTLQSPATLNSVDNTLTWDTANTSKLGSLAPGGSGSVEFSVGLKKTWPIQEANDKNFVVQVNGNIKSLTVPAGITAEQTISSANLTTKIAGQATIASLVYFKEPVGGTVNSGPYPPRVNQATQYTVHWQIRNYSTDIANVHVAALLQSGARMVKVISSNAETSPVYNSQTGQVTWDIPSILATQGLLGKPIEAVFQIEATPAINQAGQNIPLVGQTTFAATDTFTNTAIKDTALARTSALLDDVQAAGDERRVQP